MAADLMKSGAKPKVLVFLEPEDIQGKINNRKKDFPYLNEKYNKEELKLTLLFENEEPQSLDIPVFGTNTMILIPEKDQEYMKELEVGRDWKRFQFLLGAGGGAWVGTRMQLRIWDGRIGISTGPDFYYDSSTGEPRYDLYSQLDFTFMNIGPWEFNAGAGVAIVMKMFVEEEYDDDDHYSGFYYDYPLFYMVQGIVYRFNKYFSIYLDNRFELHDPDDNGPFYSPQIGIRL